VTAAPAFPILIRRAEFGPGHSSRFTTEYIYDGSDLALERSVPGGLSEYSYYPGVDQPHTLRRGSEVFYYVTDGTGDVTGLIDEQSAVRARYEYAPFGMRYVQIDTLKQPLGFQARYLDRTSGLYYFRARWYDPELQRFMSEDPIGLGGGINPYAFANDDPVNGRDPMGLGPCIPIQEMSGITVCAPISPGTGYPGSDPLGLTDQFGGHSLPRGPATETARDVRKSVEDRFNRALAPILTEKCLAGIAAFGVSLGLDISTVSAAKGAFSLFSVGRQAYRLAGAAGFAGAISSRGGAYMTAREWAAVGAAFAWGSRYSAGYSGQLVGSRFDAGSAAPFEDFLYGVPLIGTALLAGDAIGACR
jgi:RHS repeat-associated protein